jgi:hypothetical protein
VNKLPVTRSSTHSSRRARADALDRRPAARPLRASVLGRLWGYVWAAPNTALGLVALVIALVSGGRARIVDGVVEVEGGLVSTMLANIPFLEGGAAALTLGHCVIGQSRAFNELVRAHERVHVAQYERWGPLFLPAYLASSLWALACGADFYRDNYFEREAFQEGPARYREEHSTLMLGPATRPG